MASASRRCSSRASCGMKVAQQHSALRAHARQSSARTAGQCVFRAFADHLKVYMPGSRSRTRANADEQLRQPLLVDRPQRHRRHDDRPRHRPALMIGPRIEDNVGEEVGLPRIDSRCSVRSRPGTRPTRGRFWRRVARDASEPRAIGRLGTEHLSLHLAAHRTEKRGLEAAGEEPTGDALEGESMGVHDVGPDPFRRKKATDATSHCKLASRHPDTERWREIAMDDQPPSLEVAEVAPLDTAWIDDSLQGYDHLGMIGHAVDQSDNRIGDRRGTDGIEIVGGDVQDRWPTTASPLPLSSDCFNTHPHAAIGREPTTPLSLPILVAERFA